MGVKGMPGSRGSIGPLGPTGSAVTNDIAYLHINFV